MKPVAALLAAGLIWPAASALAETDFRALDARERAILGAEIRSVLMENPSIVKTLRGEAEPTYPTPAYEEEIAADQALIARHAGAIFDPGLPGFGAADAPMKIALFTADACAECSRAEEELQALSEAYNVKVTLIDRAAHDALARALGVEALPFYILPKMMLQGHMPAPVLARYLENGTGQ